MARNLVYMTPRTGRPPSDNPRRYIIRYRVTEAEMDLLSLAAANVQISPAEYARERALAAAKASTRRLKIILAGRTGDAS